MGKTQNSDLTLLKTWQISLVCQCHGHNAMRIWPRSETTNGRWQRQMNTENKKIQTISPVRLSACRNTHPNFAYLLLAGELNFPVNCLDRPFCSVKSVHWPVVLCSLSRVYPYLVETDTPNADPWLCVEYFVRNNTCASRVIDERPELVRDSHVQTILNYC